MIVKSTVFTFLLVGMIFFSCSAQKNSTLPLQVGKNVLTLAAFNAGAENGVVKNPEKAPYVYFGFPADFVIQPHSALQITATAAENAPFAVGFLFADDFSSHSVLKKALKERPLVSGTISAQRECSVSFALPQGARGFFVYARTSLKIVSCMIVQAQYGWKIGAVSDWFGFSTIGGTLDETAAASFTPEMIQSFGDSGAQIRVFFEAPSVPLTEKNPAKITLTAEKNTIEILRAQNMNSVVLNTRQFIDDTIKTTVTAGKDAVWAIVLENAALSQPTTPIPADPGLILNWNRKNWRNTDFEVFRWQQVPSVLFFDTADYATQNDFFKRLAFFVEKSGYKGKLARDEEIANKHAFNAHDYRAADLARFFETARTEQFVLNKKEILLQKILLDTGIIRDLNGTITEGEGALVSISRESPDYLRHTFIAHEGLHALYFIDEPFRTKVSEVYAQTDIKSMRFLLRYFAVTSSLNYDLSDTYLIQNEFMGYVMQQPVSRVANYFTKSIATRPGIMQAEPALVSYILETNARAFTDAAEKLDQYIFSRWGYNAGRISLVTRR